MKGLCDFCRVRIIRGLLIQVEQTQTPPPTHPAAHPTARGAQVSKASFWPSPQAEALWFQIGFGFPSEGKSFPSALWTNSSCLRLSLVAPRLLTMWEPKSFDVIICSGQQLRASEKVRATASSDHHPLSRRPGSLLNDADLLRDVSILTPPPTPIHTKWYQALLLISQEQAKHSVPVPTPKRKVQTKFKEKVYQQINHKPLINSISQELWELKLYVLAITFSCLQ